MWAAAAGCAGRMGLPWPPQALQELLPSYHDFYVASQDAKWARRVRELCEQVEQQHEHQKRREAPGAGAPPRVVVVVGARHVPGLSSLLLPVQ
jgi:hypothetical protein